MSMQLSIWVLSIPCVGPYMCLYVNTNVSLPFAGNFPNLIELIRFRGKERRINIPREVGTNFRQFGILLLDDPMGNHVENIIHKCRGNPEEINMEVLQEWVQGRGQPLAWEALVETLEDIGLCVLAKDIRDVKL